MLPSTHHSLGGVGWGGWGIKKFDSILCITCDDQNMKTHLKSWINIEKLLLSYAQLHNKEKKNRIFIYFYFSYIENFEVNISPKYF